MGKDAFLRSCSVLAMCCSVAPAAAQTVIPDATAGSTQETDRTDVPPNSDQAENTQAVENALMKREENTAELPPGRPNGVSPKPDGRQTADPKGTITVTGSRLRDGDMTTRLTVITAEDIRDRGVTSVDELIRTLPQNLATVGAISNNRVRRGPLVNDQGRATVSSVGGLGLSAANLGGVGAGNTLILVNGRRLAGAAGIVDGYVNLNGIPLSAIQRVEISNGGASAIYGADALGGVINFILRSNYVGTTLTAQHQDSSGGADSSRISVYSGYAWGSGSVSGTAEYSRREPIVNRRTGYVTNNYAPRFGGRLDYDRRSLELGLQPGVIRRPAIFDPETGETIRPETGLTVRPGVTGRPGLDDFVEIGLDSARDYVPKLAGPSSRSIGGTLNVEQKITGKLRLFGNGLFSRVRNTQEATSLDGLQLVLAPGQFYNPFPAYGVDAFSPGTNVAYFPESELADGTLDSGRVSNVATSWTANVGLGYDFSASTKLEVIYTASSSKTTGSDRRLINLISFQEDPDAANGLSCTNFALANGQVRANELDAYRAAFDRQCRMLTSSDPNVAFNPFKSTTQGGGSSINDFLVVPLRDDLGATLHNVEGRLTGTAFKLPAGRINYAAGGEYAASSINSTEIRNLVSTSANPSRYAFFGELTVPIVGEGFTLPLVRRLLLNVAARRDVTTVTGAVGTVDNVPLDQGGQVITARNRFGRTTPAIGILWSPFNDVDVRGKFTTGFKAPPATQLFNVAGSFAYPTSVTNDPLYQCTTDCSPGTDATYIVPERLAPNPALRPETSRQMILSASWRPSGFLSGFNLAATYNRNRIKNEFATLRDLYRYLPVAEALKLPQFFPRDASGKIVEARNIRFNILGSTYESLTLEASYLFYTGIGSFEPRLIVVRNLTADTTGIDNRFTLSRVGTINGPDRYRATASLQWNYGNVTTNLFVYRTPSYLNDYFTTFNAGALDNPDLVTRVSRLTTVDLSISWLAAKQVNIQFAGRNILKARAPFTVVDSLPYDTARYDVAGRTLSLSAQFSF